MLEIKKNVTLTGHSTVEGKNVQGYQATINSDNLDDSNYSNWVEDKKLYRANRAQCKKDMAEFEDAMYALIDEMAAAVTEA